MAICSFVVIPAPGAAPAVARSLANLPGCEVFPAENRELLVLLTETADGEGEGLHRALAEVEGVQALLLTFGEIEG
jgi:nitrate reductase NapAB chaperone NapD